MASRATSGVEHDLAGLRIARRVHRLRHAGIEPAWRGDPEKCSGDEDRRRNQRESAPHSLARYSSWQPPQFFNTGGKLVLKLASSVIAASAAFESVPSLAKRASKSALFSQIAGSARRLALVAAGREQRRPFFARLDIAVERRLNGLKVERRRALQHRNDCLGPLPVRLHEILARLDRVVGRGRRAEGRRDRDEGQNCSSHANAPDSKRRARAYARRASPPMRTF